MSRYHDKWYTRLFSAPQIVEDLLRSFIHEDFVKDIDFTTLKKLNTKFIPVSEKSRHADVVYEVKSRGQTTYIYLFLEFQSTVDRFMALRMGRYILEFYQEIQALTKQDLLNPAFPILIYNGDRHWDAPEQFSQLLHPSSIPAKYLPEFGYFKIAINEISKRELVKIRNAVAAIFYVENSTPRDIAHNRKELVSLLAAVLKKEGISIVREIIDRIHQTQKVSVRANTIKTIEDLTEVSSMWETNVKKYEKSISQKAHKQGIQQGIRQGIKQGIQKGKKQGKEQGFQQGMILVVTKMIKQGIENAIIHQITEMPLKEIERIRRKIEKKQGSAG